jgi:hypothetical protein
MIIPKKSKFTSFEWSRIKNHVEGWLAELHHCCGKGYEKLAYLQILTVDEHRGHGHKKYIHGIPEEVAQENIAKWRSILGDDFEWFIAEGLVCD